MAVKVNIPRSDTPIETESQKSFTRVWFDFFNNLARISNSNITPVATVSSFSTTNVPENWLECDGSAVSRNTYAALFTIIGTTYGVGDGSTTFNLPNLTSSALVATGPVSLLWMIRT